jgi:hypothetical protein
MDDLDTRLTRYRAVGPPPGLRDRIARAADAAPPPRTLEWLPALAAAAATIVFYVLASGVHGQLAEVQTTAPIREQRDLVLRQLAASLGDDAQAREEAERLLWFDEHASRVATVPVPEVELEKHP